MLYDRAEIDVQAGAGGDGCISFRREAHVPKGGPDGGDGGRGGDVVIVCDDSVRDLHAFKRWPHRRAPRGGHGQGALRHGADGAELELAVPPGTEIIGLDGDMVGRRWDLLAPGQRALLARGGVGGHGNKRFASPTRQAPRFAEQGLPGEHGRVRLRLKLLADVGLVGLPNAGKSSLLRRLTRAAPKVADYPFTTLEPALGVLDTDDRQLVIADIPGLIEGASEGAGLGHDFLGHIERCKLLVHVLDLAPQLTQGESADVSANHQTIEHELQAYDPRLSRLPRVLALSKADLLEEQQIADAVELWSQRLGGEVPIVAVSSATGQGVRQLVQTLLERVPTQAAVLTPLPSASPVGGGDVGGRERGPARGRLAPDRDQLAQYILYRPAEQGGFAARRVGPHAFEVTGKGIERLVARFDVGNEEAMAYLEGRLRRLGVIAALEAEGFEAGDDVQIAGVVFELDPSNGL